ncbi:MAG: prepilin-type N-terminal cleavage/methylation domain-containing protein [Desulfobacterales bacterium]|jgi:prepilin-type N-terminal cleavage/methylation domain-containing protein
MTIRRADTESIAGFTLIEIIVTIVVGAILAAVMVQFMSTAMTRSADPTAAVRTEAETGTVMEEIVSSYVKVINASNPSGALAQIQATYGSAAGVTMAYIRFDATGQEVVEGSATDTLKVTVQGTGYALTALLTESRVKSDDPASEY